VSALRQFLEQSRAVQVLLLNELTIFLSFYMLFPYLAVYFREHLGFSVWMVGLILGIRTLSQQGLTVIGGTLADRLGYKPLIIAGLGLRAAGLRAVWLRGLAGGHARRGRPHRPRRRHVRPRAARLSGGGAPARRTEVFALANLAAQVGTLLGPPVGVALLVFSFRVTCVVAGDHLPRSHALQFRYLPRRIDHVPEGPQPVLREWGEVLGNRGFLLFAGTMLAYSVLVSQMYLALPLEVRRVTGSDAGIGALFVMSSIMTLAGQIHVTEWCRRRYRPPEAIALGLALMGLAFLAPLAAALGPSLGAHGGAGAALTRLGPTMIAMALLSVGMMVVSPFSMAMVPRFARDRLIATYYGFYSMAGGLGTMTGNALLGAALDAQSHPRWPRCRGPSWSPSAPAPRWPCVPRPAAAARVSARPGRGRPPPRRRLRARAARSTIRHTRGQSRAAAETTPFTSAAARPPRSSCSFATGGHRPPAACCPGARLASTSRRTAGRKRRRPPSASPSSRRWPPSTALPWSAPARRPSPSPGFAGLKSGSSRA
jgi:MFS family permease